MLAPRTYVNGVAVAVIDNAKVRGLTPEEAVALSGIMRSPTLAKLQGFSGGWSPSPGKLSNEFFKTLLNENFKVTKSAGGKEEFKAAHKAIYMSPEDMVVKSNKVWRAIAEQYAADNSKFLKAFGGAWVKMMNADRFKGPYGNVCDESVSGTHTLVS